VAKNKKGFHGDQYRQPSAKSKRHCGYPNFTCNPRRLSV
jgi:hypothetical protein